MCNMSSVPAVEKEMKLQSHAVQRNLPRPYDVNDYILRDVGPGDPQLTDLQKVGTPSTVSDVGNTQHCI